MPQHASDYIKTLIAQQKLVDKNFSVQLMCDELNLPKSTVDKFLSKQTTDTSWSNVMAMVGYLGGSLDELAGIQARAVKESRQEAPEKPAVSSPSSASFDQTIALLNAAHQQELQRLSEQQSNQLDRFRRLIDQGRDALVAQHTSESAHMHDVCELAMKESEKHRASFEKGRNSWRKVALVLMVVLVLFFVYVIWEFANIYDGVTGYILRQIGLISSAGGGV